jgi:hypothetical protein
MTHDLGPIRLSKKQRQARARRRTLLIAGLVFCAIALPVSGVLLYRAWNTGRVGGSGTPDQAIVGHWVDQDTKMTWEFRRDGTFHSDIEEFNQWLYPDAGTYKVLADNLVEIQGRFNRWVVEVYPSREELCAFVPGPNGTRDMRNPGAAGFGLHHFRRDGRQGPIAPGDGVGGTAERLRERARGKWQHAQECWEFTAEGKLKRYYHTYESACRYADGKTIELTDKAGKHVLEAFIHNDTMRIWEWKVDQAGKRWLRRGFELARLPADYREDDPVAGDPAKQLLGDWECVNWSQPGKWMHFRAGGQWKMERLDFPGEPLGHFQGDYRFLPDGRLEISNLEREPALRRVFFAANKMALVETASGVDEKGQPWYIEAADIYKRMKAAGK